MSVAEHSPAPEANTPVEQPATTSRPLGKRIMHVVRRGHLYLGLFLLPWAILYGATGFLFNHPGAFPDAPTTTLDRSHLAGTPMESVPPPREIAQQVVTGLRTRSNPPVNYELVQPEKARYTRDAAFATVKADGQEVSVLLDVNGNGGTIRSKMVPAVKPEVKAPFAIGSGRAGVNPPSGGKGGRGDKGGAPRASIEALPLESPLHERVKATVPTLLERTGFPAGEVTVTSVPDLSFLMSDGEKTWAVTFNAQTGTVSGKAAEEVQPEELSTRRFLTRMHTTHVYPNEQNAKWYWAVIVDVMAFVMVFWGVSGIFMWWQIKATRKFGFLILVVSIACAIALGMGMHDFLSSGAR